MVTFQSLNRKINQFYEFKQIVLLSTYYTLQPLHFGHLFFIKFLRSIPVGPCDHLSIQVGQLGNAHHDIFAELFNFGHRVTLEHHPPQSLYLVKLGDLLEGLYGVVREVKLLQLAQRRDFGG